jgi:3-oxoacyl-[acyl-carrier-protein] synthase-3
VSGVMAHEVWLAGAAYALGEEQRSHAALSELPTRMAELKVPYAPQMLGLGGFFKTKDVYALASLSTGQTLERAGLAAAHVDGLVLSAATFRHDFDAQKVGVGQLLLDHGLSVRVVHSVCGSGCASMLNAIQLASVLVRHGEARSLLVVNIDHVTSTSDLERCIGHALVSDSAASVVVSTQQGLTNAHELLGFRRCVDPQQMLDGIRLTGPDKGQQVVTELCAQIGGVSQVNKLLALNTFLPLKKARERALGFRGQQLFLNNVTRTGHCLASDALLNWVDCEPDASGAPLLLYAEADGHACGLLVRG